MPSMCSTGPLTYQGAVSKSKDSGRLPTLKLRVVDAQTCGTAQSGVAAISYADSTAWQPALSPTCFAGLASGSDCLLAIRVNERVPAGCIALDEVQQHNLHAAVGGTYEFSVFTPPSFEPFQLVELVGEARLLSPLPDEAGPPCEVDAAELAGAVARQCFGRFVAVNEVVVVALGQARIAVRVTETETLDAAGREEAVGYHCFRGRVTPDTSIYLSAWASPPPARGGAAMSFLDCQQAAELAAPSTPDHQGSEHASNGITDDAAAASGTLTSRAGSDTARAASDTADNGIATATAGCRAAGNAHASASPSIRVAMPAAAALRLVNCRQRPAAGSRHNTVDVVTRDGEWFPVKRKLLRPCINLTRAIRGGVEGSDSAGQVSVDVDTLIFDRVLIFLEAMATNRPPPNFGAHLTEDLLTAAQMLGLRPLEEQCRRKLGELEERVRVFSFADVKARNARGECWLTLDGMVLDVTRWLPEHPGGDSIIPAQALDLDCSRFFEVYHSSRESFLYLKEFYMGEIAPEDQSSIPCPSEPSEVFLQQLREFTTFRLSLHDSDSVKVFKSF